MNAAFFSGLVDLPWWGCLLIALAMTHVTIVAVTILLHRCQIHHALVLHPLRAISSGSARQRRAKNSSGNSRTGADAPKRAAYGHWSNSHNGCVPTVEP